MEDVRDLLDSAGISFDPSTGLVRNFIAAPAVSLKSQRSTVRESELTDITDPATVPVSPIQPNGFIGAIFYDSLDEKTAAVVDPSAGEIDITFFSAVSSRALPLADGNVFDAVTGVPLSFLAPGRMVVGTPSSGTPISGAAAYKLVVFTSE